MDAFIDRYNSLVHAANKNIFLLICELTVSSEFL